MDDEKVQHFITTLGEQFVICGQQIAALRASVSVLKIYVISQMSPDDPAEGLKQLQVLEQKLLENDPETLARQQAAEVIEAVKLWRKHGGGKHEA